MKAIILFTLALGVMFTGGCATAQRVQEFAGGAAERQCDRSALERWLSQAAGLAALDNKALPMLLCPGDEGYDNFQKSVHTAHSVFGYVQTGNYRRAVLLLSELAAAGGVDINLPTDVDGCFVKESGYRLCPPRKGEDVSEE